MVRRSLEDSAFQGRALERVNEVEEIDLKLNMTLCSTNGAAIQVISHQAHMRGSPQIRLLVRS